MINEENEIVKQEKIIELNAEDYLDRAFPDGIPSNAIINKGRCGIGGTTLELNSPRHSLIIVPNIPTIESKLIEHQSVIGVYGGITEHRLKRQIQDCLSEGSYIKVLSTPDSFPKLVKACQDLEFDLYKECFLLLDEYHTVITELGYRENIIRPLEFLFEFKNKSLISATPFNLSDPRFDQFSRVRIKTEHLNKDVNVVFSKDIYGVLVSFIEQTRLIQNSNVHIFYNSVRSIANVVNLLKEKEDINIFCANTKPNIRKLGDLKGLFAQIGQQDFKKLNFYTTKYNEGWDLHDENAFIVLVSDVNQQNTCLDVEIKATQAIGRLRNKAREVYHITNQRNIVSVKTEDILKKIKINAQASMLTFNYFNENFEFTTRGSDILGSLRRDVSKFSDIDITDNLAKLNFNKVDSALYEALSKNKYSNQQKIISSWKNAGFEVNAIESTLQVSSEDRRVLRNSRIGQSKKNALVINKIKSYEMSSFYSKSNAGDSVIDFLGLSEYQKIKQEHPHLYEYYNKLGYRKIKDLNFSSSKMRKAYLLQTCNELEVSKELKDYVHSSFYCGSKYPSIFLKEELSKIYKQFNVPKNVTASVITKYFVADEITYRLKGEPVKGYILHCKT